jgi:putative tryptophan/tyrosine transport system substrate-binding protein
MSGKIVTWLLATFLLTTGLAQAQQPNKIPRIGYLSVTDPTSNLVRSEAIRLALRDLGYIEGHNIAFEYRCAAGNADRYAVLADELVHLKVDVIVVAGGDRLIQAAKNATQTIPIVMTGAGLDPVQAGFVQSLAHPGGNVTGITSLAGELVGKRLELLKEVVPKLGRVAVLYDPSVPDNVLDVKEILPDAARALRLTAQPWQVGVAREVDKMFSAISKWHPDAIYVTRRSPRMRANEERIVAFALKSRLPSMYANKQSVDAGGLMSYAADLAAGYRRVAYFVDRILKGAKPADLPIEQPTKFEFVVNLKTAKQIGLTIPPNVLARADRVIK